MSEPQTDQAKNLKGLPQEIALFELTGKGKANFERLYEALLSPTSTNNGRNFSAGSLFVGKKRTQMADSTLDELGFVRTYFHNLK